MVHLFDRLNDDRNIIMREREDRFEVEVRTSNESFLQSFLKEEDSERAEAVATAKYDEIFALISDL